MELSKSSSAVFNSMLCVESKLLLCQIGNEDILSAFHWMSVLLFMFWMGTYYGG